MPDAILLTVAGLQVPLNPFRDVVGNTGAVVPWQNGATWVNDGMIWPLTLMLTVTGMAQGKLLEGVKV